MFAPSLLRSLATPRLARRRLLTALGIAALANAATAVVLDFAPVHVRFVEASQTLEAARRLPGAPDVMFLGSSILGSLFDSGAIEVGTTSGTERRPVVFNATLSADDPVTMRFLLRLLEDEGIRPQHVIVELTPEMLVRPNRFLREAVTRFFRLTEVVSNLPEIVLAGGGSRVLSTRVVPLFFFRHELLTWVIGSPPPYMGVPLPVKASSAVVPVDPDELARRRSTFPHWLRDAWAAPKLGGSAERAMQDLLRRAVAGGLAVTAVIPPISSPVRGLETTAGWREFDGFIESARRHGVAIANYRTRLPDTMFVDSHHASPGGAREFSRMLAEDVLRPWWEERKIRWESAGNGR